MTFKKDPATGLWIQPETLPAPVPGSLEDTAAPDWLIHQLEASRLDRRTIDEIWRAILTMTWQELAAGERVWWPGIGTLHSYMVASKLGRNPRTGDTITVPAYRRIKMDIAKKAQTLIG